MQQTLGQWFKMPGRVLLVALLTIVVVLVSFTSISHRHAHASTTGGTLIWSDDFNGTSVDTSKWNVHDGAVSFSGNDWLSANNVSVQNNNMTLEVNNNPTGGKNYTSSEVDTLGHFAFLYGRVEFRALLPQGGTGIWPALWAMPNDQATAGAGNWPPEIDLWDNPSDMTTMVSRNIYGADGGHKAEDDISHGGVTPGYHVFAYDWEPGSITYMIDGTVIRTITDHIPSTPMYLLMDIVVGWDQPTSSTVFPQYFNINYVHVYQNAQNAPVTGNVGSQYTNLNGLGDPGFELQSNGTVSAPWGYEGSAGIDYQNGKAHSGQNDAYVGNAAPNTWSEVNQTMTLLSNQNYSLSCWIRTVGNPWPGGSVGIISSDGSVQHSQSFGNEGNYTQVTVPTFNTGLTIDWKVFIGYWGGQNTWAQIDDCSLVVVQVAQSNMLQDPGFENQTGIPVSAPWGTEGDPGAVGIDYHNGKAHTGQSNAYVGNGISGHWSEINQNVTLSSNTNYTLSCWIRTVGDAWPGGFVGIITPDRSVQYSQSFGAEGSYAQVALPTFNTGGNTNWKVFIGYSGGQNTWAQIDDCVLAGS